MSGVAHRGGAWRLPPDPATAFDWRGVVVATAKDSPTVLALTFDCFGTLIDWDAGLEVVAPMDEKTDFNQGLHDWLDARGEGMLGIVFGVENLEKHKEKLEAKGMQIGPLMDDLPTSPWHHRLVLRERIAPMAITSP